MMGSIVAHGLALLIGSTLAALIYEAAAGNESFSLPLASILLVTVLGSVLSVWWGWTATLSVLGVYAAYNLAGGLRDRQSTAIDTGRPTPPHVPPEPPRADREPTSQREANDVTDILFRTDRSLLEVAEALGLQNPSVDGESYWEWVIGRLGWTQITITRTHTRPPGDVDTRLFLVGRGMIGDDLKTRLVERLRPLVNGSISCGRSTYIGGNDYEFVTVEEHS